MNKKAATFSLEVNLLRLIPAVMEAKNYKHNKSDFITDCIVSEALNYRTNPKINVLLQKLLST